MENKKLWFRAKRWGWGWYPSSWQGWIIIIIYVGIILLDATNAVKITSAGENNASEFLWNYLPPLFVASAIMIWICYKTGETPRWRWNGK